MSRFTAGLAAAVAALVCLSASSAQAAAQRAEGPGATDSQFVAGELVVGFAPGASRAERAAVARGLGARVAERIPISDAALLELPAGLGVGRARALAEARGAVAYAEPNFIYRTFQAFPDEQGLDPNFFDRLWGLHNEGGPPISGTPDADIDAPEAWDLQTGADNGPGAVPIGVIDTGLAVQHPELADNLWVNSGEVAGNGIDDDSNGKPDDINGWDFVEDDESTDDENSHGTHVAGTIGAQGNNGLGITGVNWDVPLMGLKAGDADGRLTSVDIGAAIDYARVQGARVVNASFGGPFSQTVTTAIGNSPEVLVVAAAGNASRNLDGNANEFPCEVAQPNVICVAATTPSDGLAGFSNFGPSAVDLGAPGSSVFSTVPAFNPPVIDEDFEDEAGFATNWTADPPGSGWARVDPPGGLVDFEITDSPDGNYAPDADNGIRTTSPASLTGQIDCRVTFSLVRTFAAGDGLLLEASTSDTGPWRRLGTWTGSGTEFAIRDLQGSDGDGPFDFDGVASLHLRFRLLSDDSPLTVADGARVDDVVLECSNPTGATAGFKQGTSMATPHVAGAAALILAEHPGYSVADLRTALLHTVDPLDSLDCKVATGGRLNLEAAIDPNALLSPAPSNGCASPQPQPDPIEEVTEPKPEPATCAGRPATIVGTEGKDEIRGTKGADVIAALGGADTIRGRGGKDRICGGNGADRLVGGPGRDRLVGGKGRDRLFGGKGVDRLKGGPGEDRVEQ